MVTAPIKEGMTVWGNTANQDMGTVQRLYVSVGTPVATIVGVRGISDAFSQHDAVDGHVQSTTERVTDGVIGTASLALTAVGLKAALPGGGGVVAAEASTAEMTGAELAATERLGAETLAVEAEEALAAREAAAIVEEAPKSPHDPNTLASTSQGTPRDPARFQRIKNAFERQRATDSGFKTIDQSAQAQYELFEAGGLGQTGLTVSADEVLMVPNPTASTVFDEMIHTAQFRRGLVQQAEALYGPDRAITYLEIQVQDKLLRNAKAYGLTAEEVSSIQSRLQGLCKSFNAGN